ncbi:MAG: DsrE/DsrF/DrsH-like family protein [Myxococcaceae bacterium]
MSVPARLSETTERESLLERVAALERQVADLEASRPEDRLSLVVFSGDLDRILAAFIIATGAAAMGQKVDMFFTFWGLTALKKNTELSGKTLLQRMMSVMTPGSSESLPVSRMNYFGVGSRMLRAMMEQQHVESLEALMDLARELGVNITACDMSQNVMGIRDAELMSGVDHGGVGTFLGSALRSKVALFI